MKNTNTPNEPPDDAMIRLARLVRLVRRACATAAARGFEEAQIAGLCPEGAVENAVCAIEQVDIDELIAAFEGDDAATLPPVGEV